MNFITHRDSKTGKALSEIIEKGHECNKAAIELSEELGAIQFRPGYWCAYGGITSLVFEEGKYPDPKHWKQTFEKNEFMPKKNTKEGKALSKKINELPAVVWRELNAGIGWNERFSCIGLNYNVSYIGIKIEEAWIEKKGLVMPEDCKEVTVTEYKTIFQQD